MMSTARTRDKTRLDQPAITATSLVDNLCAHELSSISADAFRAVFRQHACGVAIITTRGIGPVGCTATSLVPVSMEPPLLAFSISIGSRSGEAWLEATHGVVHLLHDGQQDLSQRFSRSSNRFSPDLRWHWDERGIPVLDDALAWIEISTHTRLIAGDHLVILATVTGTAMAQGRPLLYHDGRYARVTSTA